MISVLMYLIVIRRYETQIDVSKCDPHEYEFEIQIYMFVVIHEYETRIDASCCVNLDYKTGRDAYIRGDLLLWTRESSNPS